MSVTILVNENEKCTDTNDEIVSETIEEESYQEIIDANICKTVTVDMLRYYYENNMDFEIKAETYSINIDA